MLCSNKAPPNTRPLACESVVNRMRMNINEIMSCRFLSCCSLHQLSLLFQVSLRSCSDPGFASNYDTMRHNTKPWLTFLAFNCILATADPVVRSPPLQGVDQLIDLTEQGGSLHHPLAASTLPPSHHSFNDKDYLDSSCRFSNEHHCRDGAEHSEHAQDISSQLSSRILSSPASLSPLATSTSTTISSTFQFADADHPLSCPSTCQNIYVPLPTVSSPYLRETLLPQSSLRPLLLSPRGTQGRPALYARGDYEPCAPNECRDNMESCHQQALHACQVAGPRREYCRERFSRRCRNEYIQCGFRCSPPSQDPDDDKVIPWPLDA